MRELALAWSNRLDGEYLTEPLPADAQGFLIGRLTDLNVAFAPHYDIDLKINVAQMLRPYLSQRPPEPAAYVHVLRMTVTAPVWAALEAINRVSAGVFPKAEFFPIPARLRAIAWGVAAPFEAERNMIGRILRALPPRREESAARRQAVAARVLDELRTRAGFQVGYQRIAPKSSKVGSGSLSVSPDLCGKPAFSLDGKDFPEF